MPQGETDETLPESRRREAFRALVDAQDRNMTVAQSRDLVAERFGLSQDQVRAIEREGMDRQWPPLEGERLES